MLRHTFLLIYRNFKRFKSTFFINVIGLSAGLTCALLIFLWVSDEWSFDKFNEKDNRLFQVMEHMDQNGEIDTRPYTSGLVAQSLQNEVPEVEYAVGVAPPELIDDMVLTFDRDKFKEVGQFVGKDFFNVFSYPLIEGNPQYVLSDKSSIVLSERLALKIFDSVEEIVGKHLQVESSSMKRNFVISGIFKDVPSNSSNQFDFLMSYEAFLDQDDTFWQWGNYGPHAYVILEEGANVKQVNQKIKNLLEAKGAGTFRTLFLKKYSDNYLYGNYENGEVVGGRIEYVKLFSIIALFILIIACINFMNLSTAKASKRIKEVGVKKALGIHRVQIVVQFFSEAIVMAYLSLLFALVFVSGLLPKFNEITGKNIALNFDLKFVLISVAIASVAGILAGSYPALYLSGFSPSVALRGRLGTSLGELWARRGLVIFQFTASVIMIVFVLVVYKQIQFVQSKNLGYDKENILKVTLDGVVIDKMESFLSEVKEMPGVINASAIGHDLVSSGRQTLNVFWQGKDPESVIPFQIADVNYGMIETLGLKLMAGRSFSGEFGGESSKVICNEKAIEIMGMPEDPIGRQFDFKSHGNKVEIIGVVENFHFESLLEDIKPLILVFDPEDADKIMIKIEKGREKEVIQQLESFYGKFNPSYVLEYSFLDDNYQAQYVSERRISVFSSYFAGLAIIISCLGLFGLAAFTAERRAKEIGIRKILGSSEFGIVYLLSSDFTKMVIIAIAIALPVSYLTSAKWLESFAYRIDLEWWYFLGAGFIALLVAWFTVGLQTVKAARVNPVKCLQDE